MTVERPDSEMPSVETSEKGICRLRRIKPCISADLLRFLASWPKYAFCIDLQEMDRAAAHRSRCCGVWLFSRFGL